ncbi:MAG: TFIIB-type zinc ribbon-containing protein [Nitrosopumilus sp.]
MGQKCISKRDRNTLGRSSITITDFETGEVICQDCGVVLQDKISYNIKDDNVFTKNEGAFRKPYLNHNRR